MKLRRIVLGLLVALPVAYAALCVVARVGYTHLLFPAPELHVVPKLDETKAKLLKLPQADGSHTAAIHLPAPAPSALTFVILHGNGEVMFDELGHAEELAARGHGALLVEYRGYGTTFGPAPSEAMLYEDGAAALDYLEREGVARERIVLWGWSLGSGVAAELARRGHGRRVVLLAPYTSMIDMGRRFAPFLPVSLLMAHRLDTLEKAPSIAQPVLVVHGDADELIPFEMGERVAKALPVGRLLRVEGGGHADLLTPGARGRPPASELYDQIVAFARE